MRVSIWIFAIAGVFFGTLLPDVQAETLLPLDYNPGLSCVLVAESRGALVNQSGDRVGFGRTRRKLRRKIKRLTLKSEQLQAELNSGDVPETAPVDSERLTKRIKRVQAKLDLFALALEELDLCRRGEGPVAGETPGPSPDPTPTQDVDPTPIPSETPETPTPTPAETPEDPDPTPTPTPDGLRDLTREVLIVYNKNAVDSKLIAEYYAQRRAIPAQQLCAVEMPVELYATLDQLLGARKTIIEKCICPLIPEVDRPNPCTVNSTAALAEVSPITHMTLIKGMPARLFIEGNPHEPTLAIYLSHLLYKSTAEVFPNGVVGYEPYPRYSDVGASNSFSYIIPRPISPKKDRMVAYGMIDGLTTQRALDLIDRTLEAEGQGLQGNIFWELNDGEAQRTSSQDSGLGPWLHDLTGEGHVAECRNYLENAAGGVWPADLCRAGASSNGVIPGAGGSIPLVLNAGMLLGQNPWPNGQAFLNYDYLKLVSWRKRPGECIARCIDFPAAAERDACRQNSSDFFKELNTECIGVGPGFVGHQVRSFPVMFYGVYPPGWYGPGGGATETLAPQRISGSGSGFTNNRFSDDVFLRFGGSSVDNPVCTGEDGSVSGCMNRVPFYLRRGFTLSRPLNLNTDSLTIRLRHRNGATTNTWFSAYLEFYQPSDGCGIALNQGYNVTQEYQTWHEQSSVAANLTAATPLIPTNVTCAPPANLAPTYGYLTISAGYLAGFYDYVDIDGIELIENGTGVQLIPLENGGFSAPMSEHAVTNGDYAANMIDRFGGIGWWGSSSHHLTGGWAFSLSNAFAAQFFAGETLGESVLSAGNAVSGLIYGDPLYSPGAVRLYMGDGSQSIYRNYAGSAGVYAAYTFSRGIPDTYNKKLFIDVLHGRARKAETFWDLSVCNSASTPKECTLAKGWRVRYSGQGARAGYEIPSENLLDFVDDLEQSRPVFLRLKVWNPGERARALHSFAHMQYQP